MDFNDPKVKIISILAVGVVILFAYFFLSGDMFPLSHTYKSKSIMIQKEKDALDKLTSEVSQAKHTADQLPALKKKYIEMYEYYLERKNMLPTDEEVDFLLKELETLAVRSKVKLSFFEGKSALPKGIYTELPFNVSVIAPSYGNLMDFLIEVGKMERLVNSFDFNLERVQVSSSRSNNSKDKKMEDGISAEFVLTTYSFKTDEEIKSIQDILPASALRDVDLPFKVQLADYQKLNKSFSAKDGIKIIFSEEMDKKSISDNFVLFPNYNGKINWLNEKEFVFSFNDDVVIEKGQKMKIELSNGIKTAKGKTINDKYEWLIYAN